MIRAAEISDVDAVLDIVKQTVEVMSSENNPQWNEFYPAREHFLSDITQRSLFVAERDTFVIGFICVNQTEAPEYAEVNWSKRAPCFVLHRMAVAVAARREGVGKKLVDFAENYARERGVFYLRTDTFSKNGGMNRLFQRCGFKKTGEVFFRDLPDPFNCYDKAL